MATDLTANLDTLDTSLWVCPEHGIVSAMHPPQRESDQPCAHTISRYLAVHALQSDEAADAAYKILDPAGIAPDLRDVARSIIKEIIGVASAR